MQGSIPWRGTLLPCRSMVGRVPVKHLIQVRVLARQLSESGLIGKPPASEAGHHAGSTPASLTYG